MTVLVKNAGIVTVVDDCAADIVIDGKLMHTLGPRLLGAPTIRFALQKRAAQP